MTRTFLNRILLLIALLAGSTAVMQGAETATSILDRASAKIRSDKSIAATYTISADGHLQSGTLTIAGDRFILTSPQISSWYDGKTQWTYSTQTGEVNITEPTPEELQQVNPFAIINSFRKLYKASLLKSPATEKKIKLTASNPKSDIKSVVLTLNASTLYPTAIELTMSNRRTVTIHVTSTKSGGALPVSDFRFNSKKYPGVPVVDLR